MKMKEIGPRVGVARVPPGSANEYKNIFIFIPISLDVKKFNHHNSLVSNELTPTCRIFTSVTQRRIGRERIVMACSHCTVPGPVQCV